MTEILPNEAADRRQGDTPPVFVDVRTAGEFDSCRIPGAVLAPLPLLKSDESIRAAVPADAVLVCQAGGRAKEAHEFLGRDDLRVLCGGMAAWSGADLETEVGTPRWAMDRQVRLTAGSMVLISMITSLFWLPAAAGAAFVGAGLTFSAVSNTCAMAEVLAKLPYNRVESPKPDAIVAALAAEPVGV